MTWLGLFLVKRALGEVLFFQETSVNKQDSVHDNIPLTALK